ncbi:hypothetical protein GCM10023149_47170 [Mucilaginibacter gynuensis]|uniref:PH (Pleckstrin Homology) domain-containing protein n=1 Tax=Mucilaginibacter gynuensis TaxID=1302236 RepID=A0ABP8HD58_9SPHI
MHNSKTYYFSPIAIILSGITACVFIAALSVMVYAAYLYNVALGIIVIVIFGGLIYGVSEKYIRFTICLIKKKPALILLEEKLIDNINDQVFYWNEIDFIGYSNALSGYISINLKDRETFISSIKNPFKRIFIKIDNKFFRNVISIQPNIIKCKRAELHKSIVNAHLFHKN